MSILGIAADAPATAQDMADEAATLAGLSKLLARTRSERAQLIRAFDRALQLFDAAAEGSPEQVQALAQMVSLESKISEADLQLHNVLSHADLTKP